MLGTTNITRQILWASVAVMAATGGASAQTTNDATPERPAKPPFFALIAKVRVPYYQVEHYWLVGSAPPLGQFAAGQHLCGNWKVITSNAEGYVKIELPTGGNVFAVYSPENFILDPANNRKCLLSYQQYMLEQNRQIARDLSNGGDKINRDATAAMAADMAKAAAAGRKEELARIEHAEQPMQEKLRQSAAQPATQARSAAAGTGRSPVQRAPQPALSTAGLGAGQEAHYASMIDAIIQHDAAGWFVNQYVPGSVSNVRVTERNGKPIEIRADYTYAMGGQPASPGHPYPIGWVRVDFRGRIPCLEYWDSQGTCRPLNQSRIAAAAAADAKQYGTNRRTSGGNMNTFPGLCSNHGLCGPGQSLSGIGELP